MKQLKFFFISLPKKLLYVFNRTSLIKWPKIHYLFVYTDSLSFNNWKKTSAIEIFPHNRKEKKKLLFVSIKTCNQLPASRTLAKCKSNTENPTKKSAHISHRLLLVNGMPGSFSFGRCFFPICICVYVGCVLNKSAVPLSLSSERYQYKQVTQCMHDVVCQWSDCVLLCYRNIAQPNSPNHTQIDCRSERLFYFSYTVQ